MYEIKMIIKNYNLQELFNRPDIISFIKSKRLEWFGHVWRTDEQVMKAVLLCILYSDKI